MLQPLKEFYGSKVEAVDGPIGHVRDFYFDDAKWVVRYMVVDTGSWLTGRLVLLSPHAFAKFDRFENTLHVKLQKKRIEDSPSIDAHSPVTRQFEDEYYRSYGWPVYWEGGQMWGMSGYPLAAVAQPREISARQALVPARDRHLQSSRDVKGYEVQATDGKLGTLGGFMVDDRSWSLRDLLVDTGHWPSTREIRVPTDKVERISPGESKIFVGLHKEESLLGDDPHPKAAAGVPGRGTFHD